ncbi:MAG: anti-sigma factor [Actinomycetota bacterium]|nr:anti-sigma factor [Actinomycetota bacterium]
MTLHPAITHERCSELLVPLLRGELTPADIAAVERHLEGCTGCARELAGVKSLLGAPVEAMDDLERARLRTGLAAVLLHDAPVTGPEALDEDHGAPRSPRPTSSRRVQAGAWLGVAAATVILFAGALAYLGSGGFVVGGSDRGGTAGSSQSAERSGEGGNEAARAPASGDEELDTRPQVERAPLVVRERTRFTEEALTRLGRTTPTLRAFARVYGPNAVARLRGRFARALERGLGSDLVGPCLNQTIRTAPRSLPAYGALGTLGRRRVLVLGFFLPGSQDIAVDRFEVKWWGLGRRTGPARCPQPLGRAGGSIGAGESR